MKLHPRLSAEAVVLARRGERFRPRAERDGAGWVIGYGHRASAREGAVVSDDDATVLLVYDLSQSAGRVAPLLGRPVGPALFDALNAYALRVGPDAFARSEPLRRVNAGEPVAPAEVLAARDGAGQAAPSAVLAAAHAVRDRVSQVLDVEPPPAPARPPREPWPEPPPPNLPPPAPPPPMDERPIRAWAREAPVAERAAPVASAPEEEIAAPPPLISTAPAPPAERASDRATPGRPSPSDEVDRPAAAPAFHPSAPAPVVSFERGGRPRLWDRLRGDPRLYMGVGACGLVLFLCALLGSLFGRPTLMGLALGLAGVLCLAPATAFFLQRRRAG